VLKQTAERDSAAATPNDCIKTMRAGTCEHMLCALHTSMVCLVLAISASGYSDDITISSIDFVTISRSTKSP